jgi:RNA polymerase sigma factor (sigma-70 family)
VTAADVDPSPTVWEAAYRAHHADLVRLAFVLTGSADGAEDVVHDAYLRCHHRSDVAEPAAYLRAAVVNGAKDARARARRPLPPELVGRAAEALLPDHVADFRDALAVLPFRQRAVLVLRLLVGLDDDEIAAVLDCRRSTVRSLARRGLAVLRKELA